MPTSRRRLSRTLRQALLSLLAVAGTAGVGAAVPAVAAAAPQSTLPPQGIFDNCSLDTQMATCLQRLQVIHSGGFQVVVLPLGSGSPPAEAAYTAAAQGLGMKVMWELSNPGWWQGTSVAGQYPGFAAACGCTGDAALLGYVVHFLASLPGTYGYYAADDSMLSSGDGSAVSRYVNTIKAIDPSRPVILSSANENMTAQYQGIGDMNAAEIYPVTTDSLMPASNNLAMWDGVAQTASDDQRMANRDGKASAFILQAFTFGDNVDDGQAVGVCSPSDSKQQCYGELRYPTGAAQLELRNEVLRHAHPRIILWWSFSGTYGQAGDDTYSIYPTGAVAAARWAGLTEAVKAPAPGSGNVRLATVARAGHTRHHRAHTRRIHRHRRHSGHHRHRRHHTRRTRHVL